MTKFPADFKWGVATASYQIEGGTHLDGRGPSVWDTFAAIPGNVVNQEDGSVACDHYHRYADDFKLMRDLGIQTYRFSLAWPRMFPTGDSVREQRGFDFYNRLIDSMLEHGLEPMATAYHWDLPQALQDKGGWANRDTAFRLADYAASLVDAFGDRVTNWLTLNEPWCFSWLGYANGVHAPGVKDIDQAIAAAHHTSLAHGLASRSMKSVRGDIRTGLALNMTNYRIEDPNDPELAELGGLLDSHINRWWLDAAFHGKYPQNLVDLYGDRLQRHIHDGDMAIVKVPTDVIGVNYYSDSFVGLPRPEDKPMIDGGLFPFPQRSNGTAPAPYTDMGWPITPEGLHDLPLRIKRDWPEIQELAITENGAAFPEGPNEDGEVVDTRRVDYLTSHLEALGRAVAEGAPVKAYYAWSFMDNYEWAEGYAKRFGIVHVDFDTQVRTVKDSAKAYASIISNQGVDARYIKS